MSAASTYLANKLLDHVFRNTAYTQPATVYLALYTSDPTDADVGTEVAGGSYARQSFTVNVAAASATANAGTITFPTASANWGTVTHVGIRDANAAGNLLAYGALAASRTINSGTTFSIAAGDLDITLA